jgi:hypothetical protein
VFRFARGPLDGRPRPRRISDSHDPGSGRSTLPHPPTHKQNSRHLMQPPTTSTYVATAPPAWKQYRCQIPLFTAHPEMDGKNLPLYTPRRALFHLRCPLEAQYDYHRVPGFLGLGIIRSSSAPSATSRPGLERRRSTKEQRPYDDNRGSHARHRSQGLSPSRYRHHRDTLRMAGIYRDTSLQQPLQHPPRLLLRGTTLEFFFTPRPPLEPIKRRTTQVAARLRVLPF